MTVAPIAWARDHERVAAGLVLLAVLALWFWPLALGEQMGQSHVLWFDHPWLAGRPDDPDLVPRSGEGDAAVVFHPILEVARAQVHAGRLPLWNPYIYAGMPLLGDVQSALLYPLTWLAMVLPVEAAWGPMAVLKLLTAGLGAFVLGRELRLGRAGALVAAVVFMLSAPNVAWLQWPLTTVYSLLPWLFYATHRLHARPERRRAAALAGVVALSLFAGHPETAALSSTAAGVYLVALGLAERRPLGDVARSLARWVGAQALGLALAAVVFVPFLFAYVPSITREVHGDFAKLAMPPEVGLLWLMPSLFGGGKPDYAGPLVTYVTTAGSFGVVALLLAGVAARRAWRAPPALALAVTAGLALLVAFGVPPVSWIMRTVPPFATGNNLRVLHIVALAGALGAGAGFELLARRRISPRAAAAWAGAVLVVALAGLGLATLATRLPASQATELRAIGRLAAMLVLGAACLVALGRVRRGTALALALAAVLVETYPLHDLNAILPADRAYPPKPAAVAFLQRELDGERMSSIRPGPFPPLVLPPDTSALYGLESVQGYDYPQSKRWADFSWFVLRERGLSRELVLNSPPLRGPSLTALRMLNTRLYLAAPDAPAPPGFRTVYSARDGRVFEDARALPRAFAVGRVRRLGDAAGLRTLAAGDVDPRREAVVPPDAPAASRGPAGLRPARVQRRDEQSFRVRAPGGGGWLVVANAYNPLWRAEVDGRPAKLYPTNHATMGLPLRPGARTVEFRLSHVDLLIGAAISAAALVLLAWLARPLRRRAGVA